MDTKQRHVILDELCRGSSYESVYHRINHDVPMPSIGDLEEMTNTCFAVLYPGYFGHSDMRPDSMRYYIGFALETIYKMLAEQIKRGICFTSYEQSREDCAVCQRKAEDIADRFISRLPELRRTLSLDADAAYEGDPAAFSKGETIFCYPSMRAVTQYRIAHELFRLGVPLIPRILAEIAHSQTGIDIHPQARIGERFFIDHGTGVVIGATCIIGKNVRIYQGVTLGAKSFPLDENGNPIKGIPRHPIVEDNVIIYSGATILGRITIGRNSVIGGNVWLTHSVPEGSRVMQSRLDETFANGLGI